MAPEPTAARLSGARSKRDFVVRTDSGEDPSSGVAKAFAGIAPPAGIAQPGTMRGKAGLAPFGTPAQLAASAPFDLRPQQILPFTADGVRKTNPYKMEQLVGQDAFEFATASQQAGVQKNDPARNRGRRVIRSERPPQRDADRSSVERRQHDANDSEAREWTRAREPEPAG